MSASPWLIQGPGAIGSLLACRLDAAGTAVALLHRNAQDTRASRDLKWTDRAGETQTVSVPQFSIDAAPPTEEFAGLIVTTKAYDVAEALESGLKFLNETAPVLVLANGLGHDETLQTLATNRPRLLGTISCGVRLEEGRVIERGEGPLELGPDRVGSNDAASNDAESNDPATENALATLCGLLESAQFDVQKVDDGRKAQWRKAALNCGLNPVAALLGEPNGTVPNSRYFHWAIEAARETAALGRATGLDLPVQGWRRRLRDLCQATAENRCSMLQDLEAGRPLEIDQLNGWVARRGRRLEIPTPRNRRLAEVLGRPNSQALLRFRRDLRTTH